MQVARIPIKLGTKLPINSWHQGKPTRPWNVAEQKDGKSDGDSFDPRGKTRPRHT